ncbi:hypothetical protein AB0J47_13570 [Nocardia sp. NPDC049737]|uniref:hypothetical protein n=1 Tax=Nocardia sp. NPDC049737 TaxID=3154358 RepID=UPI003422FADE
MSSYRENPPAFASTFDAVIIVAEEIAFRDKSPIIPERIARKLREHGMHSSLHSLGTRDPLAFMTLIAEAAPKYLSRADDVYRELERTWLLENPPTPRSGLRELVLHLCASEKPIVFASTKSADVAQSAIRIGLKLATGYSVVGRQEYRKTPDAFGDSVKNAVQSFPAGTRSIVIAHRKLAAHSTIEAVTPDLIQVGQEMTKETIDSRAPIVDIIDLALECQLMDSEVAKLGKLKVVRDRIVEIRRKRHAKGLTSEELAELGDLTGGLRIVSNAQSFGFIDEQIGASNARRISATRTLAAKGQHLLEVVSIDATLIEIELRNWLIVHRSREFHPSERITFGQTVQLAENNGFPGGLVSRLRTFNTLRNSAVHHLARGGASYEDLMDQYMEDCSLLFDIKDFVFESAQPIGVDTAGLY